MSKLSFTFSLLFIVFCLTANTQVVPENCQISSTTPIVNLLLTTNMPNQIAVYFKERDVFI